MLLSFIIPILNLSIFQSQSNTVLSTIIDPKWMEAEYDFFQTQTISRHANSINFPLILSVVYFTGMSILFFKLLFSIIRIVRIKNNAEIEPLGKLKIAKMDLVTPFSFFNMIFLPRNENNSMIIEHEKAHIMQFHWFDLAIAEIVSVLLWFNPFVILYKRSIKLQHEYLADHKVINNDNTIEHYLGCLLKQIQKESFSRFVSHFFYCKTIKKRIIMITKNKTSIKYLAVYLLMLPLVCLLLFAFTNSNYKGNLIPKNKDMVYRANNNVVLDLITSKILIGNDGTPSIYPIDVEKITQTSGYGIRVHPIYKIKKFHPAMDFKAAEGTPIHATASGTAELVETTNAEGKYIVIKHNAQFKTLYSHLSDFAIKKGDRVTQGQIIGYVGNSGLSVGPHLHYEVHKDGKLVDPKDYLPAAQ